MTPHGNTRRRRVLAAGGGVVGLATLVVYLLMIFGQPDDPSLVVGLWSLVMGATCLLSLSVSAGLATGREHGTLVAASVLFLCLGVLGILSIGIGFIVAACFTLIALSEGKATDEPRASISDDGGRTRPGPTTA